MAHSKTLSISKISNGVFGLSKQELEILKAQNSLPIRSLSEDDLQLFAKNIWVYAKTKLDLKPVSDADELAKIMVLMEDISEHPNLTKDEVLLALKNGLNGKYLGKESFVHFNSSNFNIWLQKFQVEKVEAMKNMPKIQEEEPKEIPSLDEQIQISIQATNDYADLIELKNQREESHSWILGGLNLIYDDLVSLGSISFNTIQKKDILEDVRLKFPRLENEKLSEYCKKYGYIYFVDYLAVNNLRIDEKGNIKQKSTY